MRQLFAAFVLVFVAVIGESGESPIVINEIMYHAASDLDTDDYIELYNRSGLPVDLSGWSFTKGIRYSFPPGTTINAGEYLVVAKDTDAIRSKYNLATVYGNYTGDLSNEGEKIALSNANGDVMNEVKYSDSPPWPAAADEFGPSLECINPNEDNTRPANWGTGQGVLGWHMVQSEGIATGNILTFSLKNPGTAVIDDVQLFDLNGRRAEEPVWPMDYRHIPSGNQTHSMHFSHIPIVLDPARRLVRIVPPAEGRILLFAITLQVGDELTHANLANYFNADGISGQNNLTDGDLDGGGATYAAELLPVDGIVTSENGNPRITWQLGSYQDGQNNAFRCNGKAVSLPRLQCSYLHLLATAVNATTLYDYLTIDYADGSETVPIQVTDWAVSVADSPATVVDIAKNGSFEEGMASWQGVQNYRTSQVSGSNPHTGNQALQIIAADTSAPAGRVQQTVDGIQMGKMYRLQFWVYSEGENNSVISELTGGGLHIETPLGGEGTPGKINSVWQKTLPPFVEEFAHTPEKPTSKDGVMVTARISCGEFIQSVSMQYTVNGNSQWMEMKDDGQHGDGLVGDGVYGSRIEPQLSQTPVFYVIQAVDALGRVGRSPLASDPTPRHGYLVYDGEADTDLPIYFLFIDNTAFKKLNPNTNDMVEAVVAIDGQVFDKVRVRYRGAWARSWPKKNWKIRFNKGNYYNNWRSANINGEYHDRAYMREKIGYDLFEDAGVPHPQARFVWMQLNGQPFGLYCEIEQVDERFLERIGREGGSAYKSEGRYNILGTENTYRSTYEKETNQSEPYTALITMIQDINRIPDDQVYNYFVQHFNVETYVDYLVVNACISNWDSIVKNHFALQDVAQTGKWEFIPWDLDRTWGEFPDWGIYPDQDILAGIQGHPGPQLGSDWWNRLQNRFLRNETFLAMYYNRMRQFLQTVFTEERMNARIDEIDAAIRNKVPLEVQIHGTHGGWDYAYEVENLKKYVRERRDFLLKSMPVGVEDWQLY